MINGLGVIADSIELASKRVPAFSNILVKYWWLSVPTIFLIYKRWQRNRQNMEFEDALMQTVLDTSPVISSAIALGFLVETTRQPVTPVVQRPRSATQQPPKTNRVVDVNYSVEPQPPQS